MTRRPLFYGLCLLLGTLLFGIAGAMHPRLVGDGAEQLATVARTRGWRVIHWSLLFGLVFMYAGLIGVRLRHGDTPGSAPARAGVLLGAFTFSVWSLNILFMVGAGWQLAHAYTAADTGLAGTHAVFVYDMLHPMGLAAERLATFMLALVTYTFGWAIRRGNVWPKWLAWLAWFVTLVCAAVSLAFGEYSLNIFIGQGVFVVWMLLTAIIMLMERRPTPVI